MMKKQTRERWKKFNISLWMLNVGLGLAASLVNITLESYANVLFIGIITVTCLMVAIKNWKEFTLKECY